jgi:CspA family cold shock protein
MQEGTVKFFDETKGLGFNTTEDAGEEIFVHSTGLIDRIKDNDKGQYETERGNKGINAVQVQTVR